jgi:hypothetical protein
MYSMKIVWGDLRTVAIYATLLHPILHGYGTSYLILSEEYKLKVLRLGC